MRTPARVAKDAVIHLLGRYHRRVVYLPPTGPHGLDLDHDLGMIVRTPAPVCLDIGANKGQTIELFNRVFERPRIHAFEPSARMFAELRERQFAGDVSLHQLAMGAETGRREFHNYDRPDLSSLLEMDRGPENRFRDVTMNGTEHVDVQTVDQFLETQAIAQVDLLKSDTQGFESEVLAGARRSLESGRIRAVLMELNFVRMYRQQSSATEVMATLHGAGLYPVGFYEVVREAQTIGWCTALFARRS